MDNASNASDSAGLAPTELLEGSAPTRKKPRSNIPNYTLEKVIGTGGFGEVWLATEEITNVRRAAKLIPIDDTGRFERERNGVIRYQQCALDHSHLLQILTVGKTDTHFYYVMELADPGSTTDGAAFTPKTLRDYCGRPLGGKEALRIISDVASGVARLHEHDLEHHDLKPDNILIVNGGIKVADVSLVDYVRDSQDHAGTRLYMTPAGKANDQYALGKILWELITGMPLKEFPKTPVNFFDKADEYARSALRIANRACEVDPGRRFESLGEFREAIDFSLDTRRTIVRGTLGWVAVHPAKATVAAIVLFIVLTASGYAAWSKFAFQSLYVEDLDLRVPGVLGSSMSTAATDSVHIPLLFVANQRLPSTGPFIHELPQPVENFVIDAHLRIVRAGRDVTIGLAESRNGDGQYAVTLGNQPDGLGMRTDLSRRRDADDGVSLADPIYWHPQAGIEYLVRLARLDGKVAIAVWPLIPHHPEPLVREIDVDATIGPLRYLCVAGQTVDKHAEVHLLSLKATSYSHPLEDVTIPPPEALTAPTRPAFVPPIPDRPPPEGNLLAGDFHPYDSSAWSILGNWSWWSGAAPGPTSKLIQATPFSEDERDSYRKSEYYEGYQFLRFDRARYRDFKAVMHVKISDPDDPSTLKYEPFPLSSHDGHVGLAIRLQDDPAGDDTWGGGVLASVSTGSRSGTVALAKIETFEGLRIVSSGSVKPTGHPQLASTSNISRTTLLAPEGFKLTVTARGPHISLALNDEEILHMVDDRPDAPHDGRIALFASRLMAGFYSLTVEPRSAVE